MQSFASLKGSLADTWRRLPISRQLLALVNTILAVLVVLFLAYDYSSRMQRRLQEKQIALTEEAKTMYESLLVVQSSGNEGIQRLIDNVCARMNATDSPGHHIAAEWNGQQFQARSHGHASHEIMVAMQAAAGIHPRGQSVREAIVVGTMAGPPGTVYVSEDRSVVVSATRSSLILQMTAVLALGAIAAVVVNVALRQLITKPIQGLAHSLKKVAAGDLSEIASTRSCKELSFLAEQLNLMTKALDESARDHRVHMEKARQIQQFLLPKHENRRGIDIAELFEPAEEVGGDYFDVVNLPNGKYLLCLADVTGHGVPAAMAATVIKSLVLEAIQFSASPAEILTRINRRYTEIIVPGHFATMVVIVVDTVQSTLSYANAGHEPPFIQSRGGEVARLLEGGLVLGVDDGVVYTEETLAIERGTRLVLVSDGVTEAFDPDEDLFGNERVAKTMAESPGGTVHDLVERFAEALARFRKSRPAFDDTTLLAAELMA